MRPEQNGFTVVTMTDDPLKPYQIWHGDKWKCPGCAAEMVTGFGKGPIAQSYQGDFQDELSFYSPLEITDS